MGIIEDSHGRVVVDSSFPGYDVVQGPILLVTDTGSEFTRTGSSCPVVFAISNSLVLLPQNCLQMTSISTLTIKLNY
jgi:hypothetical protein